MYFLKSEAYGDAKLIYSKEGALVGRLEKIATGEWEASNGAIFIADRDQYGAATKFLEVLAREHDD